MKTPRLATMLLVLPLLGCEPAPDRGERTPGVTDEITTRRDLSFPGGGRILYLRALDPGYDPRGIGLVEGNGMIRRFPRQNTFPSWDPLAPDRLLLFPGGPPTRTISSEIAGTELTPVNSWNTSQIPVYTSLDGRLIAFTPADRSGRPRIQILRLIDRTTGNETTVPTRGLIPLSWTPADDLLAYPSKGGDPVRWDPRTGSTFPFDSVRGLSDIVWSPDGHRYAGAIGGAPGGAQGVVVVGAANGSVLARVPVGHRWVEIPTWSPDGNRVAFIVRGRGRRGHRMASLHVYDVRRRIDTVVARSVSDAFWAAWSPDGRWLILDDWTRERWLFVAADGTRRIPYPWLGYFPRWCCPSSPPISVQIPVS